MSDSETKPNQCPRCGAPSATKTPAGVCTRCALEMALLPTPGGQPVDPLFLQDIPVPGKKTPCIGDYEILGVIAHGGMGVVFRARQRSLKRIVALKLLIGGAHASAAFKRRFRQEAELAARLQHPNIVPIFEVGEHEGQPFFSMEFVDGPDLARLTRERSLTPPQAAEYVAAVAVAVEYAHRQGVVHRDLKPSNILIGPDDRPRISDFGLARLLSDDSTLTLSGATLGTPGYLPPEQASVKRGRVGPHSDIYSLGAVLYHLLTGRPPFMTGSAADTLQQVLEMEPVPPRTLNCSIPRDLETICLKCLQKDPAARYPSAREVAADLRRWLNNVPIEARPAGLFEPQIKWCRRRPAVAALTAALVLTLCLAAAGLAWQWQWMESILSKTQAIAPHSTAMAAPADVPANPPPSGPRPAPRPVLLPSGREAESVALLPEGSRSSVSPPAWPSPPSSNTPATNAPAQPAAAIGDTGAQTNPPPPLIYPVLAISGLERDRLTYAGYLQSAGNDFTNAINRKSQGSALWQNSAALAQIQVVLVRTLMDRNTNVPAPGRRRRGGPGRGVVAPVSPDLQVANLQQSTTGPDSSALANQYTAAFAALRTEVGNLERKLLPYIRELDSTINTYVRNEDSELGRSATPEADAEIEILRIEAYDAAGVGLVVGLAAQPTQNAQLFSTTGTPLNQRDYFNARGDFNLVNLKAAYSDYKGGNLRMETLGYNYYEKVSTGRFTVDSAKSAAIQWQFAIQQFDRQPSGSGYLSTFKLVNSGDPKDAEFAVTAWEGPDGRIETADREITLNFPKSGSYKIKVFGTTEKFKHDFVITDSVSF